MPGLVHLLVQALSRKFWTLHSKFIIKKKSLAKNLFISVPVQNSPHMPLRLTMSFSLFCFVSSCPHLLSMASLYFAESYSAWYKSVKVVSTNPSYVRIYILFFFFWCVWKKRTWQCSIHSSFELSSRRMRRRMEQYSGIIKDIIVLPL